jgi:protein-export membrane protein SecD/preprotein translocase SecF subunit
MLNLPRWQRIGIMAITLLAVLLSLPNLLPAAVLNHLPAWYQQSRINLGLDLRGGAHFLLEADLRGLMSERLANLGDSVRGELRKEQVAIKDLTVEGGRSLVVTLRDAGQRPKALEAIRAVDRALAVSGSGDTLQIAYSDQELTRRKKEVIDQSIEILRKRVDETGTIEPTIMRQGEDRILLQVPGIKDTTELKRKINQTAKLTFHLVNEDVAAGGRGVPTNVPPTTMLVPTRDGMIALRANTPKVWAEIQAASPKMSPDQICRRFQPDCLPVLKRVIVGGEDLDDAKATFEQQQGGRPIISFTFNASGGRAFCAATRTNIGKRLAILLDNEVISAPVVQSAICGGSGIITGAFTTQQTQEQALLLRSGALPATLTIIEERTVGADLGADAIHSGMLAAIVGTVLVAIFVFAAYGPTFGGFANLAMLVNLLLVLAGMSLLGASLTLPGIAGLVLTVGMSVDSNVLIYERVREERANGRSPLGALTTGYQRALSAVIDANLTALIAGVLLFGFGSGPIRGFATSLTLGLLTHLFTATIFTRMLLASWWRWRRPTELPLSGEHMLWRPLRVVPAHTTFDFLGKRRLAMALSTAVNVAALLGLAVFGLNFGIDFEGGIAIQVKAKEGVAHLEDLRSTVGTLGVGEVSLQEFGDPSTALIRIQRQEGGPHCIGGAQKVMQERAGPGWQVKPGAAGTGNVDFTSPAALDAVAWRDAVSRVGLTVQERQLPRGTVNTANIDMSAEQQAEWCQQVAIKLVEDTIGDKYELRSTESVGPKVGEELMHGGILAALATMAAIVVYVWFRYEWQFGVGALIAMLHDIITTLGIFVIFQLDFSLTALAAVLTIAGYSINDKVVIFDRVRENMRRYKKMGLIELLNVSINEALARTLMTASTVFVAVLALVLFAGPALYSFSVAMLWGVFVGTYSSIWIACAGLVYLKLRPDQLRSEEKPTEKVET